VFLVGLAVILALVFGGASMALGDNGDFFKVGRSNFASAVSTLNKSGAGPALRVLVDSGAPLEVNSSAKVRNLNADKVDGADAPLFAAVNANGTVRRFRGLTGNVRLGKGHYRIDFNRDIRQCVYSATPGGSTNEVPTVNTLGEIVVIEDPEFSRSLRVLTLLSDGSDLRDSPFLLVINC
jgi:hypothetical protein